MVRPAGAVSLKCWFWIFCEHALNSLRADYSARWSLVSMSPAGQPSLPCKLPASYCLVLPLRLSWHVVTASWPQGQPSSSQVGSNTPKVSGFWPSKEQELKFIWSFNLFLNAGCFFLIKNILSKWIKRRLNSMFLNNQWVKEKCYREI